MALLLVAGGVLGWLGVLPLGSSDDVAVRLRPDDAELVELGANVYRQQCAACHGRDLEGQPNWRQRGADGLLPAPPHDESGHTWHHPDRVLFEITKYGVQRFAGAGYRSAMPAYEGTLRDREIVAVLSFIKSRWSTEVQEKQAAMRAR
ncbi:MAG: c-type cytochrome [Gammaproteobacteria bacterium]|nr:c-type cytochrome [Gammaproteobacteria bacterium]